MNKLFTKIAGLTLGLAMAIGVGVAVGQSPRAVERVDATAVAVNAGTGTTSSATVNTKSAIKCGTSKKTGTATVSVPSGTTTLSIHIGGWNGKTTTVGVSSSVGTIAPSTVALTACTSFAGTETDYTNVTESTYLCEFELTNITSASTITVSHSSGYTCFIVWGADYGTGAVIPQLDAPTLSYSRANNEVTWAAVDNASGYKVKVDSGDFGDTTSSRTYSTSSLNDGNAHTITVKAIGDNTSYRDSNEASIKFIYLEHAGSEADPYTVANANTAIQKDVGLADVYVSGIIVSVTSYSSQYKSIDYYISDDGTTTGQLKVYSGKGLNGADFSAVTDIEAGAVVTIYGTLKNYNSTYEIDKNNQLVSYQEPAQVTKYTVSFVAGTGASGSMDSVQINENSSYLLPTPTFTAPSGERFAAWSVVIGSADPVLKDAGESITVTADVTATATWENIPTANYKKVKANLAKFDGDYLIVYEGDGNTHTPVAFNGSLNTLDAASNNVAVTISSEKISLAESYEFRVASKTGGYSIKSSSGYYIGKTAYANGLDSNESDNYVNTISADGSNATITASGNCVMKYNYAADNLRFRFYKSGQQEVSLYMQVTDAEAFALDILNLTYAKCSVYVDGTTSYSSSDFASAWSTLKTTYNALGDAKSDLVGIEADDKGTMIHEAMARYDLLVNKYGLENFITGRVTTSSAPALLTNIESTTNVTIILVVSLVSLTAIAGFAILRKRKEQ